MSNYMEETMVIKFPEGHKLGGYGFDLVVESGCPIQQAS